MGSPAHEVGSIVHNGSRRLDTSRRAAESAPSGSTVGEFASGRPPKSRMPVVLKAERVCQARAGPWDVERFVELLTSCHGGEDGSKEADNERKRRSLLDGAEV